MRGAETDGLRSLSAAIPNRLSGCTSSPGRRYHPRRSLPLWAVACFRVISILSHPSLQRRGRPLATNQPTQPRSQARPCDEYCICLFDDSCKQTIVGTICISHKNICKNISYKNICTSVQKYLISCADYLLFTFAPCRAACVEACAACAASPASSPPSSRRPT